LIAAGVENFARDLNPDASGLTIYGLGDLQVALRRTPLPDRVREQIEAHQDGPVGCAARQLNRDGLVTFFEENIRRSRVFASDRLRGVFDLQGTEIRDPAERERQRRRITEYYGIEDFQNPDLGSPEVMAFLGAQALKHGVSRCVSLEMSNYLDTHYENLRVQPQLQERAWQTFAGFLRDLMDTPAGEDPRRSVYDYCTILVYSEFSRTPLLNGYRGRDHHVTNSCLLSGAGIRAGLSFGTSSSRGMMPLPTNLRTGETRERPTSQELQSGTFQILSPKHVLATMLAAGGLDYSYLRTEPVYRLLRT
jgi:hypothetical protein